MPRKPFGTDRVNIRLKHGDFLDLYRNLFHDSSRESFAVALASTRKAGGITNIVLRDIIYPKEDDYSSRNLTHLAMAKKFIHRTVAQAVERLDIDTVVDIHTHPFTLHGDVTFSSVDDQDERIFSAFLRERFNLQYASMVFSPGSVSGRFWKLSEKEAVILPARVRPQTDTERAGIRDVHAPVRDRKRLLEGDCAMFNRSIQALGLDTIRSIIGSSMITVAGVGGLGSIVAEHLVHMGFQKIGLIDHDRLEISNMNRIVGATWNQAGQHKKKIRAIKGHLKRINPLVQVTALDCRVEDPQSEELMAGSDWIILATDTHSSRFSVLSTALKHFVPLISAGVNISVENKCVTDVSGEVITMRAGDNLCLRCLHRIDHVAMAFESHPAPEIRKQLVDKGYVRGLHIREPAVKTLNTMLATMAVDRLVDQFIPGRPNIPVLIYENNGQGPCIYPDPSSVHIQTGCSLCDI